MNQVRHFQIESRSRRTRDGKVRNTYYARTDVCESDTYPFFANSPWLRVPVAKFKELKAAGALDLTISVQA